MVEAVLLFTGAAVAQPVSRQFVDLKYDVDPALEICPNVVDFRAIIEQQLGYDPYRSGLPTGVEVRVLPADAGIQAIIRWNFPAARGVGERRFASRLEDCRKMMATVGFVVAVQIQLMAAEKVDQVGERAALSGATDEGTEGHGATGRRAADTELTLERFELRQTASSHRSWAAAGIGPSVGFGLGPKPVALGRLFFALRSGWFGLDTSVEASRPVETREPYGAGFRHSVVLGALGFCGWYGATSACAVASVGQIQIRGFGVDKPASPKGLIARVGPRLAHSLRLTDHLMILGHIEALSLLGSRSVALNHLAVWTMPRLGTSAGIDLALFF